MTKKYFLILFITLLKISNANNKDGTISGHAVTLYGYVDVPGCHSICIMNSGQPEFASAGYNSGKFSFPYNNKVWTWKVTVIIEN